MLTIQSECMASKYAPKSMDEYVGQPKVAAIMKRLLGHGGHAYFITGPSGTGKTSLAHIVAESVADPECIMEYDTPRELDTSDLLRIKDTLSMYGMRKGGRALIINEAHGLRQSQIEILLGMIDSKRIPKHIVVIFTTTKEGEESLEDKSIDAGAFLSRCKRIALTNQGLSKPYAEVALRHAQAEGLASEDCTVDRVRKLVEKCKNNLRAVYSEIEAGALL